MTTRLPKKARNVSPNAGNSSEGRAAPRSRTKGDSRRESILDAAASLLESAALEDLTYRAVCAQARVPESSAYHFFPDLSAVYRSLLTRLGKKHDEYCFREPAPAERKSWKTIVGTTMERSAAFQRRNPIFAKLTISGKVPFDLKQFDRTADRGRAGFTIDTIDKYFILPRMDDLEDIFYIGCELYDQVAILSMIQYGLLTPAMVERGKVAAIAFIQHYIGEKLAVRPKRELAPVISISR
jgi:AcrR family transcriptional regulator